MADTNYAVTKGARTGIPAIEGPLKHLIMTLSAQGKTLFCITLITVVSNDNVKRAIDQTLLDILLELTPSLTKNSRIYNVDYLSH